MTASFLLHYTTLLLCAVDGLSIGDTPFSSSIIIRLHPYWCITWHSYYLTSILNDTTLLRITPTSHDSFFSYNPCFVICFGLFDPSPCCRLEDQYGSGQRARGALPGAGRQRGPHAPLRQVRDHTPLVVTSRSSYSIYSTILWRTRSLPLRQVREKEEGLGIRD